MNLQTGRELNAPNTYNSEDSQKHPKQIIGGNSEIYWSSNIQSTGNFRLFGFGLTENDEFHVYRIIPKSGKNIGAKSCGIIPDPNTALFMKPYTVNGQEVIGKGDDELIIDASGYFKVEYVGSNVKDIAIFMIQEPLTNMQLEARVW